VVNSNNGTKLSQCKFSNKVNESIRGTEMKYQIEISGMHCAGCSNLIKMALEDEGLDNSNVDINTNLATFESSLNEKFEVKEVLDKVFADLPGYSYANIQIL
jgi:copper chaperone CopZ